MVISRRKFLQAGTVVALAAGFPLKNALTASGQRTSTDAAAVAAPPSTAKGVVGASTGTSTRPVVFLSKATFTPHVNTAFVVQSGRAKAVEVKLVQVNSTGPTPDRQIAGKECFSLIFSGQQRLSQDVYKIQHPALGKFDLLLVPIGKEKKGKGQLYEAVINRLN
ncbi:MAG TPA: twin-arginine translocation signal domain-containing protein [Pyrinomonadaceae bacterium]|jgi:hypothetical protein